MFAMIVYGSYWSKKTMEKKENTAESVHRLHGTPLLRRCLNAAIWREGQKHYQHHPTAREFYDTLPDQAKYPDMTGIVA